MAGSGALMERGRAGGGPGEGLRAVPLIRSLRAAIRTGLGTVLYPSPAGVVVAVGKPQALPK